MVSGEICANCSRPIGKLETPRIWQEQIVCAQCWAMLEADRGETAIVKPPAQSVPVRRVDPTPPPRQPPPVVIVTDRHTPAAAPPPTPHDVYVQQPAPPQQQLPVVQMYHQSHVHVPTGPRVKPRGAIATCAVMFAVIALFVSWVPVLGLVGLPLAGLAVLLGVLAFLMNILAGGRLTTPLAAIVLGGLAAVIQFGVTGMTLSAADRAQQNAARQAAAPQPRRDLEHSPSSPAGAGERPDRDPAPPIGQSPTTMAPAKPVTPLETAGAKLLAGELADAERALAAATASAEQRLAKDLKYASLVRWIEKTDKERKDRGPGTSPESRLAASASYSSAKKELEKYRADFLATDPQLQAAKVTLAGQRGRMPASTQKN